MYEIGFEPITGFMLGIEYVTQDDVPFDISWGLAIDLGIFRIVILKE